MLWTLMVILLILWALGLAFKVAGAAVYVLLVIAIILFIIQLASGRKTRV